MIIWSCTIVLSFFVYSFIRTIVPDLWCRSTLLLFCVVLRGKSSSGVCSVRSFVLCIGIPCLVYDGKDISYEMVGL